ncbi:MAG TPA: alpha/beta hydrolase [Acidimicrobiia bacterium]|nr:alpha/beta hydrolase [Acidimicrobiia bacterium]
MDAVILDEEIEPALAAVPLGFELSAEVLPAMRAARGEMFAAIELSDAVERTDHLVSDDPHVVVRVHRPKAIDGPLPCVYSIHGGGYVLGSYDMDDAKFDRQCVHMPCVGVSVEYRLAPETAYPGPLDDCYAGCAGSSSTPTSSESCANASASRG